MQKLAWGKPTIKMGKTQEDGSMSENMQDIGKIKEDTTAVNPQDGGSNEMYGEGHELLDEQQLEGYDQIEFTVVSPTLDFLAPFYGGTVTEKSLKKITTIVKDKYSVDIVPEKVGAIGYKASKCSVRIDSTFTAKEGWLSKFTLKNLLSEADGFSTLYERVQ